MFKEIKGYSLNVKEYEKSIRSHSFLNVINLLFAHMLMWVYAIVYIYILNICAALLNSSIPEGKMFHYDAFDLVLSVITFYIVMYVLLLFTRDDHYYIIKNATLKRRDCVAGIWLLYRVILGYKLYARSRKG